MFTIRVYGLVEREGYLLFSSEIVHQERVLKFPGGGLEFGEGTLDALVREFREELQCDIEVLSHIYTTDYYVPSFLNPNDQVLSIYYQVDIPNIPSPGQQVPGNDEGQHFIWQWWKGVPVEKLTFPIDREVLKRLQEGTLSFQYR